MTDIDLDTYDDMVKERMSTHKRDTGGNVKNLGNVFCFLELIGSCAKNLQKIEHFEGHYPTIAWLEDEVEPTIQKLVDGTLNVTLARMYLQRTDRAVIEFKKLISEDYDGEDDFNKLEGLWMISAMAMMIDDIMQAIRSPERYRILAPLEDTIVELQERFDKGNLTDIYEDSNEFVNTVSKIMWRVK